MYKHDTGNKRASLDSFEDDATLAGSTEDVTHLKPKDEEVYSMWTFHEKLFIIFMTGSGTMLSSLSANVYFPAIPTIAKDLDVSVAQINLTITSYLVFQGLAPMLFGPMADYAGRRLVYLICLSISFAACAGMAFLPDGPAAYPLLIFLRCVQSSGSATMISLGYGSISDIATPGERGFLAGLMSLGQFSGPALGPVIGGLVAGAFGWRGVFCFMAAFSLALFLTILLFLPETLRAIVNTGEVLPPRHLRPLIPVLAKYDTRATTSAKSMPKPKRRAPVFLKWPDALLMLVCNAFAFGLSQSLMSSLSIVLSEEYPFLTQSTVGLSYLPVGLATCFGSVITGRLIDREFRREGGTLKEKIPVEFNLEKARLRLLPFYVLIAAACMLGYGWTVGRTPLPVPLIFTFFYGFVALGTSAVVQQILMDLTPGQGATVTAANNLFRCTLGAIIVSTEDPLRGVIGNGGVMSLFAAIALLIIPIIGVERKYGRGWRKGRADKEAVKQAEDLEKHMK